MTEEKETSLDPNNYNGGSSEERPKEGRGPAKTGKSPSKTFVLCKGIKAADTAWKLHLNDVKVKMESITLFLETAAS